MNPRRHKLIRRLSWIATALVWAGLFIGTHIPATRLPDVHVSDKWMHFAAYFGLSAMIYVSTWITNPSRRWTGGMVLAIAMVYGAMDELLQPLVNRDGDVEDWLCDVAGAAAAVMILVVVRRLLQRRPRRPAEASARPVAVAAAET